MLEASLTGKQTKEVAIDADPAKLTQYGLVLNDLVKAVQNAGSQRSRRNFDRGRQSFLGAADGRSHLTR